MVVAIEDPDPNVGGRGIARLRARGITVDVGVEADAATRLLAPYLVHRALGRSFVVLKTATSLDGRIAARDGSSRWITGPEARADVHELRADSQAVIVGAGTALADEPSLTARDTLRPVEQQPLRVLLDAQGRVPAAGPLFDTSLAPTLVITTTAAPGSRDERVARRRRQGADGRPGRERRRRRPPSPRSSSSPASACCRRSSRVAPQLAGALLDAGLVDRLVAYVAPTILGRDGRPAFDVAGPSTIADAPRLQLVDVTRLRRRRAASTTSRPAADRSRRLMFTGIVEELGTVRGVAPDRWRRAARDRGNAGARRHRRSARRSR